MIRAASALILVLLGAAPWAVNRQTSATAPMAEHYYFSQFALNLVVSYVTMCCLYVLSREASRQSVLRILTLTASAVICVGILEIPTMLGFDYGTIFSVQAENDTWLQLSRGVNRPDPELIHMHKPSSEYSGRAYGNLVRLGIPQPQQYRVELKYDKNGFRNSSDLKQADIVSIGDSFLEAALVSHPDIVTSVVQRRLGVPVANLGQSNYGMLQELEVLRRFGLGLRPKVVLWFFFDGNDLNFDYYQWQRTHLNAQPARRPIMKRLLLRNALMVAVDQLTPTRRQPTRLALDHRGIFTLADGSEVPVYFGYSNGAWTEQQWNSAVQTLSCAKQLCDSAGAHFAVVYISRKYRIYRESVRFEPGSRAACWEVNDLPQTLGNWCDRNSIHFINTVPELKRAVGEGKQVYLADDVHWNVVGHRVTADLILKFLDQQAWLSKPASPEIAR